MIGIYCIENLINGKKYIGKSRDIKDRFSFHRNNLKYNKHFNDHLQSSWNKYGENNFNFYILKECSIEQLDDKEKYYIKKLKTKFPNGYNFTDGGDGSNNPSDETRRKMSNSAKGKVLSDETKKRLSENAKINPNYGMKNKNHSESSKKKMSKTKKGMFIGINGSIFGKKMVNSTSEYFGVHLQKQTKNGKEYCYWITEIRLNKELIQIKCCKEEIDAAKAYNEYIIENNLPNPLNIINKNLNSKG